MKHIILLVGFLVNTILNAQNNCDHNVSTKVGSASNDALPSINPTRYLNNTNWIPRDLNGFYVEDCILETDLELRIPEVYINNVAERLSIYQAIDNLENEEDLARYVVGLKDRFGPLPKVVEELIKSFRLRWMASSIGLEKIIIKNRTMIGYFIADPSSDYYASAGFTKVLDYLKSNPADCKISEKNNKLRLIYGNVNTLDQALGRLSELA